MRRQDKRNIVTLVTFFVMILLFCLKASSVHIHMIAGLVFIAALIVYTIRSWEVFLKCPCVLR